MPHVLSTDGWPEMQWTRLTNMPADRWQICAIDGSNKFRAEASQAALQWVTDTLAGRASVFRRAATSMP
jgi:hypothetical protein